MITLSAANIRPGGYHVQSNGEPPAVALQPSSSSSPADQNWFQSLQGNPYVQLGGAVWAILAPIYEKNANANVQLSDVQLQAIAGGYLMVSTRIAHTLTIRASSEWKAQVVVFVGQDHSSYVLDDNTQNAEFQQHITGPGSLAIHIIPLQGKAIENLDPTGHVSYNVSCELDLDGEEVGSFSKNGWDPRGSDFPSQVFNYT